MLAEMIIAWLILASIVSVITSMLEELNKCTTYHQQYERIQEQRAVATWPQENERDGEIEEKKKAVIQALRQLGFNADVARQIVNRLEQSGGLDQPLEDCIREALREAR